MRKRLAEPVPVQRSIAAAPAPPYHTSALMFGPAPSIVWYRTLRSTIRLLVDVLAAAFGRPIQATEPEREPATLPPTHEEPSHRCWTKTGRPPVRARGCPMQALHRTSSAMTDRQRCCWSRTHLVLTHRFFSRDRFRSR